MYTQCSGGSRSLAEETRALKTRSLVANHQDLLFSRSVVSDSCATPWTAPCLASLSFTISWSWQCPIERLIKADPLTTTREVDKELNSYHSTVVWHLKQIGKSSASGCLTAKKKKSSFWSVVFYYSAQQQWTFLFLKKKFISFVYLALPGLSCRTWDLWCGLWVLAPWPGLEPRPPAMRARGLSRWAAREVPNEPFLDWTVMCNKRWILYYSWWWPAQWLDWEEAPKHFPKPNLHQKRSWSLMPWSTTAFWIPANVCSANWGDWPKTAMPAGGIGQQNGPSSSPWQCSTTCRTTNASKVE